MRNPNLEFIWIIYIYKICVLYADYIHCLECDVIGIFLATFAYYKNYGSFNILL